MQLDDLMHFSLNVISWGFFLSLTCLLLSCSPWPPGSKHSLAKMNKAFFSLINYSDLPLKCLFYNMKYVLCVILSSVLCSGGMKMSAIFLKESSESSYVADCSWHQLCLLLSQPKHPQRFYL